MGTSELETFVAAANMFLGQSDSPLLISKYLDRMTESEIMVVLVSGMGSMSVNVLSALTEGGATGLQVVVSITVTIMVMTSAVALINGFLGMFGTSLQQILGILSLF